MKLHVKHDAVNGRNQLSFELTRHEAAQLQDLLDLASKMSTGRGQGSGHFECQGVVESGSDEGRVCAKLEYTTVTIVVKE